MRTCFRRQGLPYAQRFLSDKQGDSWQTSCEPFSYLRVSSPLSKTGLVFCFPPECCVTLSLCHHLSFANRLTLHAVKLKQTNR